MAGISEAPCPSDGHRCAAAMASNADALPLEDEAERRLAPWNQPFEVRAYVRVRACPHPLPLLYTTYSSLTHPLINLASCCVHAVSPALCPAATFAARRSEREALLARQAQHRENRQQPRGDHRPGGKLQEERERQKQR